MGRNLGRNPLFAGVDLPDDVQQLARGHVLEHVSPSAGFERALDLHVALEGSQHDDAGVGKLRPDRDHDIDPAGVGKAQIHQSDIWPMLAKPLQGFARVGCFGYQRHIGLAVDNGGDPFAQQRMVVNA